MPEHREFTSEQTTVSRRTPATCRWTSMETSGPGPHSSYPCESAISLTTCSEPCLRGHRSSKCKHFDRLMSISAIVRAAT
ncbi:hypothetical protein BDV19DRAFT_365548 [Aspergillus venezuelensis]